MKYNRNRKILLFAIILAAVVILATVLFAAFAKDYSFQGFVEMVLSPFQSFISEKKAERALTDDAINRYQELLEENAALKEQINQMEELVSNAEKYKIENENFRDLLDMQEENPTYNLTSADFIAWNDQSWGSLFTINAGTNRGIKIGDPVITRDGLVGFISDVSKKNSTVSTILDTSVNFSVRLRPSLTRAVSKGDFNLMKQGLVKVSDISLEDKPVTGEKVLTVGTERIPDGILVGTLTEMKSERNGMLYYGIMTPLVDFNSLSQLFIITDFDEG